MTDIPPTNESVEAIRKVIRLIRQSLNLLSQKITNYRTKQEKKLHNIIISITYAYLQIRTKDVHIYVCHE